MRALGLGATDVRVRLSDRRILTSLLDHLGQNAAQVETWFQVLDKFHRTPAAISGDKLRAAGVSDAAISLIFGLCGERGWDGLVTRAPAHPPTQAALTSLLEVKRALDAMGVGEFADFDLTIVRGLAYYTGTVFELFDARGELRAICGGGRYDQLLLNLGGVDLPAVGFGMGDVVLGELLRERGKAPASRPSIDVLVAGVTGEDAPHVLRLAHELRDAGVRVEYSFKLDGLGKQLKLADARNAALAIVIGPDDRARGEVQLKDLVGKSQRAVAATEVVGEVKRLVGAVSGER
jgi:histidyl-tRNA synthetase